MIFPSLIRPEFCKTPIKIFISSEEIDEDGNPQTYEFEGYCNYQGICKTIFVDDKKTVQLSGKCYIPWDIFPELPTIGEGEVILFDNDIRRKIFRGSRNYNPDSTINYVMLELI